VTKQYIVTVFDSGVLNTQRPEYGCAVNVIDMIIYGRCKDRVDWIRRCRADSDEGALLEAKRQLPVICWSGRFSRRDAAGLIEHSGIVVLDFDHVEDAANLRDAMREHPHCMGAFISPSGDGVKALMRADAEAATHASAWAACADSAEQHTGIRPDESGKDVCRACFASYDPDAWWRESVEPIAYVPEVVQVESTAGVDPDMVWSEIPTGHRHQWLVQMAARAANCGFIEPAITAALKNERELRMSKSGRRVSDDEIAKAVSSGIRKYHGLCAMEDIHGGEVASALRGDVMAVDAAVLVESHKSYREPVIDGLLREGETINIIAAPKTGKSWMVLQMSYCIANGLQFLGLPCTKGNVLIVDNELHPETAAMRLAKVADAVGVLFDGVSIMSLRGRLRPLDQIGDHIASEAMRVKAKVIVLDALYRLLGAEDNENSNADMMRIYNNLDRLAAKTGCAIVVIHHASKGDQASKGTTDGGSGAGSIARASDTHVFIREHEEADHLVIDAVARSFAPPPSIVARRINGVLVRVEGKDPGKVKGRKANGTNARRGVDPSEIVAAGLVPAAPVPMKKLIAEVAEKLRCTKEAAGVAVMQAADPDHDILQIINGKNRTRMVVAASYEVQDDGALHEKIIRYIDEHPEATATETAIALDCSARTVRRAWADKHE
jgi:hypothetical protein